MENRCIIIGGGGHAKVVIELLRLDGRYLPFVVTDSNKSRWGESVLEVPVAGGDEKLAELGENGIRHFVIGIGSVRSNELRSKLYDLACDYGLNPVTVSHPTAKISEGSKIGMGTVLMAGSIVNIDVAIGNNCVINSGAIVEHDCQVSDHAYLSPGVCLASSVVVEEGAFIGIGAVIKQGVRVARRAVVGAGSVVLHDVPAETTVVGIPAHSHQA